MVDGFLCGVYYLNFLSHFWGAVHLKVQIVLEALKEIKPITQIASEHQLHPNLVTRWKQETVTELPVVFERENTQAQA